MTELMRAAGLAAFPETARAFGLDPETLLAWAGIDLRALRDPEMRIATRAYGRLLERAAELAGVETFGLRMAETRNVSALGPIGLLLREEPTLRCALQSLARYLFLHIEGIVMNLKEVADQAVITSELRLAQPRAFRQGVELMVAVLFRILQAAAGPNWQPLICFVHEPPRRRDLHHRVFGPRVDFRCDFDGLIFPARDLERPVAGANPVYAEHARRYLDLMAQRSGPGLEAKVREMVRAQLASGRCTAERLARQLGCDRRTLHRRLAREQVTFDAILSSVRQELAVRLLESRRGGLAEIADLLGFSDSSAFSRWFVATFGTRPSEWRRAGGGPAP